MLKIILTKGLPASGKTTWAKEMVAKGRYKRINKDDLRAMLDNSKWSKGNEKFVLRARDMIILSALVDGFNVIVDDTNLHEKHQRDIQALIASLYDDKGIEVTLEMKDFTDVPPEVCIERDLKRANSVGSKVIMQMYNQFLKPKVTPIADNPDLQDCIVCDIDGTLALFGDANPYDRDFSKDKLNLPVSDLLGGYMAGCDDGYGDVKVILVSGRKDIYRKQTEEWLKTNYVHYDQLFMRKTASVGQEPKDVLVKKDIYDTEIKGKYNVIFVLDDRDQVVELWRSLGLTCLQVAEGDF